MSEPEQLKSESVGEIHNPDNLAGQAPASTGPSTLGAQLAGKREQFGWSVAEVASHLKLAPRQIEAMEADNYAALPTMVMTRGFIRSYAKLLGLDVTASLAAISPAVSAQPIRAAAPGQLSTPFSESRFSLMGRSKFAYKWLVVLAVLLLLLAVAIRFDVVPGVQNALHALTEKAAASATSAASEEAVASSASSDIQAADKEANAALTAAPTATLATPAKNGAAVAEVGVNAGTTSAATAPAAASGGELNLNFRQDSWVDVKRADNTVLISRLVKAGSTETVDMSQPVSIIIGNLAGVDATLRGAPLDLKTGSKTNVARLNLK